MPIDEKSTLGKECNSKMKQLEESGILPSMQTLDIIRMFARVYSSKNVELQTESMNF